MREQADDASRAKVCDFGLAMEMAVCQSRCACHRIVFHDVVDNLEDDVEELLK